MVWNKILPWKYQRYIVAVALVAAAAALRIWPLQPLGVRIAWLTFYPTVMVAALYGGISAGLLAAGLSCLVVVFFGPVLVGQSFIRDAADWLGMAIFFLNCVLISGVAEAARRANKRAKQAQEKAEAANKSKSVFLANMSHELRTPLNAILGFSSLLRTDAGLSEEQRKTMGIINRSGEHLLNLINNVLDMAKIEAGRSTVENEPFDLGDMVRDIIDLMGGRAEEKNLELLLDQSSVFPRCIKADSAKMRQIFINLIGNAIKFTEQGTVTLHLKSLPADIPESLRLIIEVQDTGIGIAPEEQERIFEPFVQVGKLTHQKGTGLGLTITARLVELLGGRISLESMPGKGSKFLVEFPVCRAENAEVRSEVIKQGHVIGCATGQPEQRILIVEDQMENWLLLRRLLEDAGFKVCVAGNGVEGIELFQSWQPHFIWMDIRMPVMDGIEATQRIRQMEGGKEVKISALSASVFKEERDKVMAAGMDDFVRKPYRPEEIFDCLSRHLDMSFVYEKPPVAGKEPGVSMNAEALTIVPETLRRELAGALISLDGALINALIGQVSQLQPALGEAMATHADRLEYTVLLQALQADTFTSGRAAP